MEKKFDDVKVSLKEIKENVYKNPDISLEYKNYLISLVDYLIVQLDLVNTNLILNDKFNSIKNSLKNYINKVKSALNRKPIDYTGIKSTTDNLLNNINNLPHFITYDENETFKIIEHFRSDYNSLQKEIKSLVNEINQIKKDSENVNNILSKLTEAYENDLKEFKEKFINEGDSIILDIKRMQEDAKKLVNVVGNIGQTGRFKETADYHRKQANFWRWIAIGLMTLAAGGLIFTLWHLTFNDFEWYNAMMRILAISALFYPATYAAKESSKHRNSENINRKLELELATINPFIEILTDEEKRDLKKKMAERYFGNNLLEFEQNDNEKHEQIVSIGLLEQFANIIIKVMKNLK